MSKYVNVIKVKVKPSLRNKYIKLRDNKLFFIAYTI